jgi:putative phosphoesterase
MRIVVVADTHMRTGSTRRLPDEVWRAVEGADLVLHAGDIVSAEFLDELEARAPTWAVLGNNDLGLEDRLPESVEAEIEGVGVAMIHDSGARAGRERRMARRFPDAALVVFGHSHIPIDAPGADGQRLFNPGSPTERRRQPHRTYGELVLADGAIVDHRIIPVPPPH